MTDVATEGRATPAILIQGARKDYGAAAGGRRNAVVDVSIEVSAGAVHGLLGPNGAGKTTTLKMLLGLVRPSGGTFQIHGVPASKAGAKRCLGYLPEQPYFPTNLTVAEAMSLYGGLSDLTRDEVRSAMPILLERVGLDGREKTPLSRFSRGMLQRLGLAQALLGDPSVLVLDEPASGLDPVGQRDVRRLMLELAGQGVTILLSSHQLSEVEMVCDEVTILDRGRVAARGSIDDLLCVRGLMTIRSSGGEALPSPVERLVRSAEFDGELWSLSIDEADLRPVIDALDAASWRVMSAEPMRDTLEDFFARMLDSEEAVAHA